MNCCWEDLFGAPEANFLPPRVSDHSLIGVCLKKLKKMPHSFKFFNMWCDDPQFINIVVEVWRRNVKGTPMFRLYSKLKSLKKELKKLKREKVGRLGSKGGLRMKCLKLKSWQQRSICSSVGMRSLFLNRNCVTNGLILKTKILNFSSGQ